MRAIGAANGRNPVSIVLPCHRVIGSDGSLTGFGGGLEVKAALLELDGSTRQGPAEAFATLASLEEAHARSRAPSSKQASPEESASPARAGRNRGT